MIIIAVPPDRSTNYVVLRTGGDSAEFPEGIAIVVINTGNI